MLIHSIFLVILSSLSTYCTAYNVSDFVPRSILDEFRAEIRNRSSTDVTEPPLDPQGEITELIANFQTDMSSRLWNETGPSILDVRQVNYNDCWWKAVQVSVTHISKQFIMKLFVDPNNGQDYTEKTGDALLAPKLYVKLFNPYDYTPEYYPANINLRDRKDDKGGEYGVFWPDAMTQTMRQHMAKHQLRGFNTSGSYSLDEGTVGESDIATFGPRIDTALSILTGKPAWINDFIDHNSSDTLYSLLERSIYTPMMFTSQRKDDLTVTDPAMKEDHVYPVISTYYNATTNVKMVHTRNVWGRTDNFTMADVWRNGKSVIHLRDFDGLQST